MQSRCWLHALGARLQIADVIDYMHACREGPAAAMAPGGIKCGTAAPQQPSA